MTGRLDPLVLGILFGLLYSNNRPTNSSRLVISPKGLTPILCILEGFLNIFVGISFFKKDNNLTAGALLGVANLDFASLFPEIKIAPGTSNLNRVVHERFLSVERKLLSPQSSGMAQGLTNGVIG